MRNQYAGHCFLCGHKVLAYTGFFQRRGGKWVLRCQRCVGKGNKTDPLTDTQLLSMLTAWKRAGKSMSWGYGVLLKEAKRRKLVPNDAQ